MTLAHPMLAILIVALPLAFTGAIWMYTRRRRRVAAMLGDSHLLPRLVSEDLRAFPRRRAALMVAAALCLAIAAVGPVWGVEATGAPGARVDVVLVLDASNSMRVEDLRPNRLERERQAARQLITALEGSRIGLVVFAGRGYILSPLTTDFSALELYLEALSPEMVTQGGSSLSSAIWQGTDLFLANGERQRPGSLVVMTDGDALEEVEEITLATRRAKRAGISVHTVGIGTSGGGPVPDVNPLTGLRRGFKRHPSGATATSALGAGLLRRISAETDGTYFHVGERDLARRVVAALRSSAGARRGLGDGAGPANRYEWFLALALLLVVADALTELRSRRRVARLAEGVA